MNSEEMQATADHQAMLAVRDGDIDRLGDLFEKYNVKLYNYFFHQTGDRQASEDLVQDVFFRILKYRHTYRGEGRFTTWMLSIAHNAVRDFYRKARCRPDVAQEMDTIISHDPDPGEQVTAMGEIELLKSALAMLPEGKRQVLLLSRYQHLKYEEIAEIVGCKIGTVKARVSRAMQELSKAYFKLTGE